MSTRGCIAERQGDHWEGVYQHFDSYPTELGKIIWDTIHGKFKGDVQKFLNFAIHKHDGGWSSFPKICYCHGKFAKRDGTKPGEKSGVIHGCDCNAKPYKSGNKDKDNPTCDPLFIEWVYVLDPKYKKMAVLSHFSEHDEKTCEGAPHYNCSYTYRHKLVTVIDLNGEEPNWEVVECGEELERCRHVKSYHDQTLCPRCYGVGVVMAGGSRVGFHHKCTKQCVPNSQAPEIVQVKGEDDTWHIFKPESGWGCTECGGTGKRKVA